MTLYRRGGSKTWNFHFWFEGVHHQETTKTRNKKEAADVERGYRVNLVKARAGFVPPPVVVPAAPVVTFKTQSEKWIAELPKRLRRPAKPATIAGYQQALDAWLLDELGEKPLAEVTPSAVRDLVQKLSAEGLSAKTIKNYFLVVRLVMNSAIDEDGNQLHPRQWNLNFMGMPVLDKKAQHRPTITKEELESILNTSKERYTVLFAVLAGTGLRIGEALGLKGEDFSADCREIHITRSLWYGAEQAPKTSAAVRVVDVPKELARIIQAHRVSGYLFHTAGGEPRLARNVLRYLHARHKVGFHAFRRYRAAVLLQAQVPEILAKFWLGHSQTLTEQYAKQSHEDVAWRQEWCDKAGLGFPIEKMGPHIVAAAAAA